MSSPDVAAAKRSLRRELLARRTHRTDADRAWIAAALAQVFAAEFESRIRGGDIRPVAPLRVVALYLSFATEPGTGPLIEWLADQRVRSLASTVLPDADLDWIEVPDGTPLGLEAITDADVILAPALAVDLSGHRLGRGGGSYDRALTRVRPGQTVLAVVHDDEVLDAVPNEPHDRIVDGALTPSGVRYFGTAADG
ncbi:MAG TPA: 5-formyltetrahydrofolate cyclo-ligase [Acidothermaceae bacterium]|nr:5-formyltetrahydrofolate cyclo-ligase [Acidothermaceae bacterium]